MYNYFIEKIEKQREHSDCPLCHREFDDADESIVLVDELKGRVEAMPTKVLAIKIDFIDLILSFIEESRFRPQNRREKK
jgi:hypothetical protein